MAKLYSLKQAVKLSRYGSLININPSDENYYCNLQSLFSKEILDTFSIRNQLLPLAPWSRKAIFFLSAILFFLGSMPKILLHFFIQNDDVEVIVPTVHTSHVYHEFYFLINPSTERKENFLPH